MRNALVIRLSSLGDVVLAEPALAGLKAAGFRTSLLVKEAFAPVFEGHPAVDEVLVFERRGFWGWARGIRGRFDLVLDLHGTLRSLAWSALSGAARRSRYDGRKSARRLLVHSKRPSPALSGDVVDRYLEALAPLGVRAGNRAPDLGPAPPLSPALLAEIGPGPFLALAPGALHATKRWPAERFAEAAAVLARESSPPLPVLVLGSPGDREAASAVVKALGGRARDLCGRTGVRDLMAVLGRSALVLSNDSGAAHLAAGLGVPVVAVFGPTVRAFGFFPRGAVSVVETPLACRPCSVHGSARCPLGHFRCMGDIPAAQVVAAARALGARAAAGP